MISENKGDEAVNLGGEQVRTTFRNVAAPEQFDFDEAQWAGQPLPVILTAYREAYGQTVYQVAETLRIRAVYIQYLESGQYDELPGDTYATGFIRTYATYLGLPVDQMVALYKTESAGVNNDAPAVNSSLSSSDEGSSFHIPKLPILIGAVALAAVLFVGWYYFNGRQEQQATPVAGISENLLEMLEATKEDESENASGAGETSDGAVTAADAEEDIFGDGPVVIDATDGEQSSLNDPDDVNAVEAVASLPSDDEVVAADEGDISSGRAAVADGLAPLPEPKPGREVASAEPAAALTPLPTAAELNGVNPTRVVIQANQLAWLQIRKPGDEILLSKVMQPGETQEIPDQSDLRLLTGSIDGLSISVDGKEISPSGPNDGYSVDISLNPEELLAMVN